MRCFGFALLSTDVVVVGVCADGSDGGAGAGGLLPIGVLLNAGEALWSAVIGDGDTDDDDDETFTEFGNVWRGKLL